MADSKLDRKNLAITYAAFMKNGRRVTAGK